MFRCHWPWTKSCVLVHSGAKSTKEFSFKLRLCICSSCHRSHWRCKVGSNLPRVTCFPALCTSYMFSRAWHRWHVFPRLHQITCFPVLLTISFFLFPLTSDWLIGFMFSPLRKLATSIREFSRTYPGWLLNEEPEIYSPNYQFPSSFVKHHFKVFRKLKAKPQHVPY